MVRYQQPPATCSVATARKKAAPSVGAATEAHGARADPDGATDDAHGPGEAEVPALPRIDQQTRS